MRTLLALAFLLASPADAEVSDFNAGMILMITAHYDTEANRFSNDVPKREQASCFDVSDKDIKLSPIGGTHKPWWADQTYQPGGYTDVWCNSDAYLQHNPGARPLDQLKRQFSAVARCPAEGTG